MVALETKEDAMNLKKVHRLPRRLAEGHPERVARKNRAGQCTCANPFAFPYTFTTILVPLDDIFLSDFQRKTSLLLRVSVSFRRIFLEYLYDKTNLRQRGKTIVAKKTSLS